MALQLTITQFLTQIAPLAKQYDAGTLTLEQYVAAAEPIYEGFLIGDARTARFVSLVVATDTFENRLSAAVADWYTGTADGGPNGDGLYPLPNADGEDYLVPSPALLTEVIAKGDPGRDAVFVVTASFKQDFGANEELDDWQAPFDQEFAPADCMARLKVAPTGAVVFRITKNGADWGTISFAAGSNSGVHSIASPTVVKGDVLTWWAPVSADPTARNAVFSLVGARP